MTTPATRQGALAGVRVVDLTHFEAGPFATMMLAMMGAEVFKVERPGSGDPSRMRRPGATSDAPYFTVFNTGKKSVALDLGRPEAVEALKALIAGADVLVENLSFGAAERLGLGYETLRVDNPRLIYCQITGFAPGSRYESYAAYDPVAQAMGGSMSVSGSPGDPPQRPGVNLGDSGAGLHAAMAICAALFERERTGRGQRIVVPMQDCVLNLVRAAMAGTVETGQAFPRVGNEVFKHAYKGRAPFPGPSNAFRCLGDGANDYCFIHVLGFDDGMYRAFFTAMGQPELIEDPRFASHAARLANMDALDAAVAQWTATRSKTEVMDTLARAGITAGAVLDTSDLMASADLQATGGIVEISDSNDAVVRVPGFPVRMDGALYARVSPKLGADTEAVLQRSDR